MKNLFSILFSLFIVRVMAQDNPIPNPGFENWSNEGSYYDPADWGSDNYITAGFNVAEVESDTIAVQGLSARLTTKQGQIYNVPGILCSNGFFNEGLLTCQFGFPCTYAFKYFNGYVRYSPSGDDIGGIIAVIWKWSPINQKRDTLSKIILDINDTNGLFTYFSEPFSYFGQDTPDSAIITISSSKNAGNNPPALSKLNVDNLEFADVTAAQNLLNVKVNVYPNPANESLTMQIPPTSEELQVSVYDLLGREILMSPLPTNHFHLSTRNFPEGIFFYRIKSSAGKMISGGSFEVQH